MTNKPERISAIANELQVRIAADAFPNGGEVVCSLCGTRQKFTRDQAADYLRHGWPQHCGTTMTLERLP
jgi:hypothetical protein